MPIQLRQEANKQTPRPWGLRQVRLWKRVTGTAEGAVTLIVCVRACLYLPEKAGYVMLIQLYHEVTWGAQWAAYTCFTQDRSVTYWIYLEESQVGFSSLCPGLEPRTSHMPDKTVSYSHRPAFILRQALVKLLRQVLNLWSSCLSFRDRWGYGPLPLSLARKKKIQKIAYVIWGI